MGAISHTVSPVKLHVMDFDALVLGVMKHVLPWVVEKCLQGLSEKWEFT